MTEARTARIQDVARAAGVSTATVSRTLSAPERVSLATREAVLEAVRATGYSVNRAARSLRTSRAGAILVLVPDLGNPFFSQILAGIEGVAAGAGLNVLISDSADRRPDAEDLTRWLAQGQADGLLSLDGALPQADLGAFAAGPHGDRLVFACEWTEGATFPVVRSDNRAGAEAAVDHLADLGHRDIGYLGGPPGNVLSAVREAAFRAAVARRGLPADPGRLLDGDFSLAAGRAAARRLLAKGDLPTAVFCASDQMALGLIGELDASGIRVPRDLSVVGFDDIEIAAHYAPRLTTVRQHRQTLGARAAELLLGRLEAPGQARETVVTVPVDLVVRGSTGPAPAG